MPDNFNSPYGIVGADEHPYLGNNVKTTLMRLVHVVGAAGAHVFHEIVTIAGTFAAYGLNIQMLPLATTSHHRIATADTNPVSVKGAAGTLYSVDYFNTADYPVFVKFHDVAGAPVAGTTAVKRTLAVQATKRETLQFPRGIPFALGIAYTVTKNLPDNDVAVIAAGDGMMDMEYI